MKAKTILLPSDCFRRLPYLTGNLPPVITDTTHTLGSVDPHAHLHTQALKESRTWSFICVFVKNCFCVVCHCLRLKCVICIVLACGLLSIVILFIIIVWDTSSYMALLMFYVLTCFSFFRYHSYGFRSLSMYFLIDYYHFRNYRNISVVFISENIVSISFSRKNVKIKVIWPPVDRFRPYLEL
jgi:hypothetical protein